MDLLRKKSSFLDIEFLLVWITLRCHVTAQKSTFYSSQKNWGKFCFWADDSYVEKSEKNIGARIFTLSLAVFPEFVIKVSREVIALIEKYKKKLKLELRILKKRLYIVWKFLRQYFFLIFLHKNHPLQNKNLFKN